MDFSVAICAYNASKTISAVLDAALSQKPTPSEILVVDDASSDGTAHIVAKFPTVRLKTLAENQGIGHARNCALDEASHDIVIFLDSDAVPRRGCFGVLLKHISKPGVAAVGGRGEEFFRQDFVNRFRALYTPQSLGLDAIDDAPMFMGICFALNKSIAKDLGGFDAKFRTNGEDADMSIRLRKAGYKIYYEPIAVVDHLKFDNFDSYMSQSFRFSRWMMRALKKNKEKMGWYIKPATKNLLGNGLNRLRRLKLKEGAMFLAAYFAHLVGMIVGFFG